MSECVTHHICECHATKLANLATRLERTERERVNIALERDGYATRAEVFKRERDEARDEFKQFRNDTSTNSLYDRIKQAERERDEAKELLQVAWDDYIRHGESSEYTKQVREALEAGDE